MTAAAPQWVYSSELEPLWRSAFRALERSGRSLPRTVAINGLTERSRREIGALVGRVLLDPNVRLDVASLQDVLLARCGLGLLDLVEAVIGPVPDRAQLAADASAARSEPVRAALDSLTDAERASWGTVWADGITRHGLVARFGLTAADLRGVVAAITRLPVSGLSRPQFAAEAFGDAHALDPGSVRESLVLRGLAARAGKPMPTTEQAARRLVWEAAGVLPDLVSSTCLLAGVAPIPSQGPAAEPGRSSALQRLRAAAAAGDPIHLTGWDLRALPTIWHGVPRVLVCENPQVLEAVVGRFGADVPVICTSGQPSLVTMDVLRRLRAGGAQLDYHGDFDWSGIAITNRLAETVGVLPWRMAAADYLAGAGRTVLPLLGGPSVASWSESLTRAMQETGVAVHEEVVLDLILTALERDWRHQPFP